MKDKDKEEDLRVEPVEGAPFSIKKVDEHLDRTGQKKDLHVLIDNTGSGFVNDSPQHVDVTIQAREDQAMYFLGLNLPMPPYLKKYLEYMYEDDGQDVEALYKYAKHNHEMKQLIGFIQLVGGTLNHARKKQMRG